MFRRGLRVLSSGVAAGALALSIATSVAGATVYWSPSSAPVYDGNSLFMLVNSQVRQQDLIRRIECKSILNGKTPIKTDTTFKVTLSVSACTLNGSSIPVTASGPSGPIYLVARTETWHPYWGAKKGGGDVIIPVSTSYEFKVNLGPQLQCTVKTESGITASGFSLAPYYFEPPELAINKAIVGVSVSETAPGPEKCGLSGVWRIDTWHPKTNPGLQIIFSY